MSYIFFDDFTLRYDIVYSMDHKFIILINLFYFLYFFYTTYFVKQNIR